MAVLDAKEAMGVWYEMFRRDHKGSPSPVLSSIARDIFHGSELLEESFVRGVAVALLNVQDAGDDGDINLGDDA